MAEQEQERNEAATPFKLREARKRGQTARSPEVTFVVVLAAFVGLLYGAAPGAVQSSLRLMARLFGLGAALPADAGQAAAWIVSLFGAALQLLAPFLAGLLLAAAGAGLAQVGPGISFTPLKPDFTRINPASGWKRLLSWRLVYDAAKNCAKLLVLGAVLALALRALVPQLVLLAHLDGDAGALVAAGLLAPLLFKLVLVLLVLALLDFAYTRWEFARKMRMSKREITDEHKQREGDPRIRGRLRQLRLEMLRQARALRSLPQADVLVTNPTHLAVAIGYRHGEMPAPRLLAKGAGDLALRMRELAARHHIPVVENRALARALYRGAAPGEDVPEALFPAVARLLVWVFALRRQRAGARP